MKRLIGLSCLLVLAACGSSKAPTAPTTPAPTQTRIIALQGAMDFGNITLGTSFTAVLRIYNNGNNPLTISGITGSNGITNVTKADWTSGTIPAGGSQGVNITFTPTAAQTYGGTITVNGDQTSGANTIAFSGTGSLNGIPVVVKSGVGDSVFSLPTYVTRVRVDATYSGSCQNFIARVSTQTTSLINVIIGTCSVADTRSPFSGTYAINNGGTVQITGSTGVAWTFTEIR